MNCPKCKAPEPNLNDQHGERIVCMSCGYWAEAPTKQQSAESKRVLKQRLKELSR